MQATYFDGRSAHAFNVEVTLDSGYVSVVGDGIDRRDPLGAVEITDALGGTLRRLRFTDGASCEVADNDTFAALLAQNGLSSSQVSRWERGWRPALLALSMVLVFAVVGYRYGLPFLAQRAADNLPESALNSISYQIQRVLDRTTFAPTKLSGTRLARVLNAFDALLLPGSSKLRLRLEFRDAEELGANAMALPSGAVFVTDQLVKLTDDDRILMAVLAHEAGHVQLRHGLRQIIQSTVIGVLITWYIGDVSALGAAAPTALLQAKYSRDLEREADRFAVQALRLNGLSPALLAEALDLIQKSHGRGGGDDAGALAYVSTHPATAERLTWLRTQ